MGNFVTAEFNALRMFTQRHFIDGINRKQNLNVVTRIQFLFQQYCSMCYTAICTEIESRYGEHKRNAVMLLLPPLDLF
jgi:hypothetical protein